MTERSHAPVPGLTTRDWGGASIVAPRVQVAFVATLLLLLGAAAYVGTCVTRQCPYDLVFLTDNGWRVACGLRTHADFSSAWGPVTFLLTSLGLGLSGGTLDGLGYAGVVAAALVGPWAYLVLWRRVGGWTAVLLALLLALLCCAPLPLGWSFRHLGHAMNYNRWGYALTFLAILECLPGGRRPPRGSVAGGASTGAALALLLFLKVSFFLGAGGLVALSLLWREGRDGRRLAGVAGGFLLVGLALLPAIGFDLGAMFSDLRMAAVARAGRIRWTGLLGIAVDHAPYVFVLLALGLVVLSGRPDRAGAPDEAAHGGDATRAAIFLGAVYGLDVLLRGTNAQVGRLPLSELTGCFLGLLLARRARVDRSVLATSLAVCGVGLAVWPVASDVLALGTAANLERRASSAAGPPWHRSSRPRLAAIVFEDGLLGPEDGSNRGEFLTEYLDDGARLLEAHARPGERVTTFDAYNPFPYVLGVPPPRGGMSAAAVDYTFSAARHLPPESFFGEAELVMVPKVAAASPEYAVGLEAVYGAALKERFDLAAESSNWRLLRRRSPPR